MDTVLLKPLAGAVCALAAAAAVAADPNPSLSRWSESGDGHSVRLAMRDGPIELGSGVMRPSSLTLDQVFGSERIVEINEHWLANGSSFALTFDRRQDVLMPSSWTANTGAAPVRLAAFSLVARRADGQEISVGVGGLAANYFGAGGLDIGHANLGAVPALANPYFSLVPSARHAGISREFNGVRIKFGILSTGLNHAMAMRAFDPGNLSPALVATAARANSRLLELSKSFEHAALSFSVMRSVEENAYLGLPAPIGSRRATNSMQLTGVVLLAPKLALAAQASYGRTPAAIFSGDTTRTNAFSVALVASDRWRTNDRLSLAISQPVRRYDGLVLGSVPNGRELLAEMNYVAPLAHQAYAGWSLAWRRHPDNRADAAQEKLLAFRFVQYF